MDQETKLVALFATWMTAARASEEAQFNFNGIACRYFTPEERMAASDRACKAAVESTRAYRAYAEAVQSSESK